MMLVLPLVLWLLAVVSVLIVPVACELLGCVVSHVLSVLLWLMIVIMV